MTGRHAPRRRHRAFFVTLGVIFAVLVVVLGGASYAAIRYERAHADRILPGVSVHGVDVSGMTRAEAVAAVRAEVDRELSEPITVTVGHDHWTVTPATLGRRARIGPAVQQALVATSGLGTLDRAWHRLRDEALGVDVPLTFDRHGDGVASLVATIARRTDVEPRDASIQLTADGTDLTFVHAAPGARLNQEAAVGAVGAALERGRRSVTLHLRRVDPKVTEDTMGRTIVVRVDQNRLYLYDGFSVMRSFSVATAKPGYTTPVGDWTIYDKQVDPAWHNPALDSWGADLPAVVPGGPGNPMGPRALYITAPGLIRIHGTTDDGSIGRYASHGCIRMHNTEVIQLYPLIDVGDHVLIVGTRPADAGYWSVPPSSDI